MHFKSAAFSSDKSISRRTPITCLTKVVSVVLVSLTLCAVPQISLASRSQTASTSPSPNVSNIAAAAAAGATRNQAMSGDGISPVAEPPEQSSDRGFSTDDFLHFDDGKKRQPKRVSATATVAPQPVDDPRVINLRVKVTVPQNKDAVNKFVAYPYPMPVPVPKRPPGTKGQSTNSDPASKPAVPKQAYDKMPATRKTIRDMILQTSYTNRTKRSVAYPQGGWRWQMAYSNALHRSHREEPSLIGGIYSFLDVMEPLVKDECEKFDDLEDERQRRYQAAFEEFQINRGEAEYEATKKGYYPVEFNLTKGWRGHLSAGELKLGPGTWWITGTHKVAGLTYYWQYPVQIASNSVEDIELNWQNALVIEGGW